MNEMPSFADPANLEPKTDERFELEPNATSLKLLQKVYRSPSVALMTRVRAAIASLQFEHPKLAVVATVNAGDFADKLDQAIARSRKVIEAKPTEANVSDNDTVSSERSNPTPESYLKVRETPHVSNGGHKPSVPDRRFRRW